MRVGLAAEKRRLFPVSLHCSTPAAPADSSPFYPGLKIFWYCICQTQNSLKCRKKVDLCHDGCLGFEVSVQSSLDGQRVPLFLLFLFYYGYLTVILFLI